MRTWIVLFALVVLLLYLADYAYRQIILPFFLRRRSLSWLDTHHKRTVYRIFKRLYAGAFTKGVANSDIRRHGIGRISSFTYGEVEFIELGKMLEVISPSENSVMVDLGSGAGKAVFAAALLYPTMRVVGVELMTGLYELSINQWLHLKELLKNHPQGDNIINNIAFIQDDVLETDFSGANIVFMNATCFDDELMAGIEQALDKLALNSYVIITTKEINHDSFQCVYNQSHVMSWGKCRCRIYCKITA